MKTLINTSFIIMVLIAGILISSCEKEDNVIPIPKPVSIDDTDSLDCGLENINVPFIATILPAIDTFTFCANEKSWRAKIFVPASYETNKNLPAIFLIDFEEQHFTLVEDEFETVIEGVQQIAGIDALVVSLENIPDIDASPGAFQSYFEIYKKMASYVDGRYTGNSSRTFIGRGSEAGIVIMACFLDNSEIPVFQNFVATDAPYNYNLKVISSIKNENVGQDRPNSKLHFSFSTSNRRPECIELINTINEANYPWLNFNSIEYTNSNFTNTYPEAFATGLKFIFEE